MSHQLDVASLVPGAGVLETVGLMLLSVLTYNGSFLQFVLTASPEHPLLYGVSLLFSFQRPIHMMVLPLN